MKPNSFIFNSDWLSLAEAKKSKLDVYFVGQQFPFSDGEVKPFSLERTFNVEIDKGGIDQFIIKYNNKYYVGGFLECPGDANTVGGNVVEEQGWVLRVYRISKSEIKVKIFYVPDSRTHTISDIPSTPSLNFEILVSSFKVPNIF